MDTKRRDVTPKGNILPAECTVRKRFFLETLYFIRRGNEWIRDNEMSNFSQIGPSQFEKVFVDATSIARPNVLPRQIVNSPSSTFSVDFPQSRKRESLSVWKSELTNAGVPVDNGRPIQQNYLIDETVRHNSSSGGVDSPNLICENNSKEWYLCPLKKESEAPIDLARAMNVATSVSNTSLVAGDQLMLNKCSKDLRNTELFKSVPVLGDHRNAGGGVVFGQTTNPGLPSTDCQKHSYKSLVVLPSAVTSLEASQLISAEFPNNYTKPTVELPSSNFKEESKVKEGNEDFICRDIVQSHRTNSAPQSFAFPDSMKKTEDLNNEWIERLLVALNDSQHTEEVKAKLQLAKPDNPTRNEISGFDGDQEDEMTNNTPPEQNQKSPNSNLCSGDRVDTSQNADNGLRVRGVNYIATSGTWRASFQCDGRLRSKSFSARKYGFEKARQLAIAYRHAVVAAKSFLGQERKLTAINRRNSTLVNSLNTDSPAASDEFDCVETNYSPDIDRIKSQDKFSADETENSDAESCASDMNSGMRPAKHDGSSSDTHTESDETVDDDSALVGQHNLRNLCGGNAQRDSNYYDDFDKQMSVRDDELQSGVRGVYFHERAGCWMAKWYEKSRQRTKYFPINKYGFEMALREAIECRKKIDGRRKSCYEYGSVSPHPMIMSADVSDEIPST